MDFDAMDKDELLKQVKRLAGGGLGRARAYNELNQLDERDPDEIKDGYQLRFIGKDYARLQASQQTETVLVPNVAHNDAEGNKNSQNIFITGDNLDALKHLENSYSSKVDVIYIDPPYNTGSDGFVYADNFRYSDEELKLKLGLTDSEVERIRNLEGKSSHSAWLTFMYPRLRIAKRLLSDKGVIFISIDDNEQANLKVLCDEIFAENNMQAIFPRVTKKGGKSSDVVAKNHDYVLMYVRKKDNADLSGVLHNDAGYSLKDEYFEDRGFYKLNQTLDYDSLGYVKSLDYPIQIENEFFYAGGDKDEHIKRQSGEHGRADWGWRWSKDLYVFGKENGFVEVKCGGKRPRIYTKTYQNVKIEKVDGKYKIVQIERSKPLSTLDLTDNQYSNDNATKAIDILIGKGIFEYTKPALLIMQLMRLIESKNSTVLDFFAGSATTGDAVMQLNAEDGGNRRYILVQLDEKVASGSEAEKQGYKTIDQISRKRLEKASEKIRADKGDRLPAGFDGGFKHYTLATTSETILDKLDAFDPGVLLPDDMSAVFDGESLGVEGGASGDDTLLATWLIDDGFGLNADVEMLDFAGAKAHRAENRLYILDNSWSQASTAELLNAIGKNKLPITSVVIYAYALNFETMRELKVNLKTNLDQMIEIIERF